MTIPLSPTTLAAIILSLALANGLLLVLRSRTPKSRSPPLAASPYTQAKLAAEAGDLRPLLAWVRSYFEGLRGEGDGRIEELVELCRQGERSRREALKVFPQVRKLLFELRGVNRVGG